MNIQFKYNQLYPEIINLRIGALALPLNPIVWRKADRAYRCQTTFSPSALNRYFMEDSSGDKDILCGLHPGYGYLSGGSFEIQKYFLAPDFYLNCFFDFVSSFTQWKNIVINLVNPNTAVQSPFFVVDESCLSNTLYLRGKACQIASYVDF